MFNLSVEQVAEFNEDGFLIVEHLIEDGLTEELLNSFEDLFQGEFETGITPDEVNWQQETGDPSLTRRICNGWKANRTIASVVTRPDLGKSIATLGNWPVTRLMIDNVVWKPSGTRSILYHQDNAYLKWYTPSELLSCWIALDDTTASGGTIEFVRGSHKWQHSAAEGEFHGPDDYRRYMRRAPAKEGVEPDIVHVEAPKGGGSFHHGWTWHRSDENSSSRPCRSLVLHGMPSDAQSPGHLTQGTGAIYSRYKHLEDNLLTKTISRLSEETMDTVLRRLIHFFAWRKGKQALKIINLLGEAERSTKMLWDYFRIVKLHSVDSGSGENINTIDWFLSALEKTGIP